MACTCKEDYEYQGNVRIGRNRVMCQECIDANARQKLFERSEQIRLRLLALDAVAGPRAVREILLAEGKKGFNNILEVSENEAIALRAEKITLGV